MMSVVSQLMSCRNIMLLLFTTATLNAAYVHDDGSGLEYPAGDGTAAFERHDYDLAIHLYSEAIDLNTNYSNAYYGRASAYEKKGQYTNALVDVSKAISLCGTNFYYFLLKAEIDAALGKLGKASDDLGQVIKEDPSNLAAYVNRARIRYWESNYDLSIMDCYTALSIDPASPEAYFVRADSYFAKTNLTMALNDYDKSIQLNPTNIEAHFRRGYFFAANNQFSNAVVDYTEVVKLTPEDASAYVSRGFLLAKMGDYGEGINDYQKAIALNPNYYGGYNNFAWLMATASDPKFRDGQKALEYAKKACELTDWKDPHCLGTLAAAYAQIGDFDGAIKWQKKSVETASEAERAEEQRVMRLYLQDQPYKEGK